MPRGGQNRIRYSSVHLFPNTYLELLREMPSIKGRAKILCRCLYNGCGNEFVVTAADARNGHTKSCGCYNKYMIHTAKAKHGLSRKSPLYNIWGDIKKRCYNEKTKAYKNYGGRGIYMVEEWLCDVEKFASWCLENGWQKGLQIDRIDNDGPYAPWNCRFVTRRTNCRNKRTTVFLTIDGVRLPMIEHVEKLGLSYTCVSQQCRNGNLPEGWVVSKGS